MVNLLPTPSVDASDRQRLLSAIEVPKLSAATATLSPEQALQEFQDRDRSQGIGLQGYTDETLVVAELSDTSRVGTFELQRAFVAPRLMRYKAINFIGDTFIKSNVISRVLQSEVDYAKRGVSSQTALTEANYGFSSVVSQRYSNKISWLLASVRIASSTERLNRSTSLGHGSALGFQGGRDG